MRCMRGRPGVILARPAAEAAADLAVASMTGANRIWIGLGWSGIALYAVYRATRTDDQAVPEQEGFLADAVELDPRIGIEILFLGVATVFAFLTPINGESMRLTQYFSSACMSPTFT